MSRKQFDYRWLAGHGVWGAWIVGIVFLSGCRHADHAATTPSLVPPQSGAAIRFVDVAAASGIRYRWSIPGKRPCNLLQTIGNGCALLDVDNDGNLDVLLVGPKLALYRGDGKGHFTDVTAAYGLAGLKGNFLGCAVGDYDNDGYEDIYLTAYRGGVLLHNVAREPPAAGGVQAMRSGARPARLSPVDGPALEGRCFRDVTVAMGIRPQPWGTSAAFADIDGDGRLDLYIANYVRFGPLDRQFCNANGQIAACGPVTYVAEQGVLYRNEGARFRDVTREWGCARASGKTLGVGFADYDRSGRQSLALANDEMAGNLFHNEGKRFIDVGAESGTAYDRNGAKHGGMGLDWGDYDNDGKLDLVVATYQQEVKNLYHNDGELFSDQAIATGLAFETSPYVAFGVKFVDVDNDGWLDILLTNGHTQDNAATVTPNTTFRQPIQLFHNERGVAFKGVQTALTGPAGSPIVGRGLAVGDFDNDGRMDALIVDSAGAPLLLHNETTGGGHWLEIRLRGTTSNRDGIGAQVTFILGSRKLLRICHTDGSYMSASDRRIHCGLGSAVSAQIEVTWPDGHHDAYGNIAGDRIVTLTEGGKA